MHTCIRSFIHTLYMFIITGYNERGERSAAGGDGRSVRRECRRRAPSLVAGRLHTAPSGGLPPSHVT